MNKKLFAILASAAVLAVPTAANAQAGPGQPTFDFSAKAIGAQLKAKATEQLNVGQKQLTQMMDVKTLLGSAENLMPDFLGKIGLNFGGGAGSDAMISELKDSRSGFMDAVPNSAVGKSLGITPSSMSSSMTTIKGMREVSLNTFFKSGNATMDEITARRGLRQAAMRDSLTAGYAMATVAKGDINKSETLMKSLSEKIGQSKDLRSDVQSNSAIALAQLRQMTIQNQLMAQMLEVQSTAAMAEDSSGGTQ